MEEMAKDLMIGAGPIALEVLGEDTPKARRKIYHLHQQRALPTFKLAGEIAARRSTIRAHIVEQERAAGTNK